MSSSVPPRLPTTVECPRCGVRQPLEIYPLTALSDPDNVGWVRTDPDEDDAFTQWHECEIELWDGEYDR